MWNPKIPENICLHLPRLWYGCSAQNYLELENVTLYLVLRQNVAATHPKIQCGCVKSFVNVLN